MKIQKSFIVNRTIALLVAALFALVLAGCSAPASQGQASSETQAPAEGQKAAVTVGVTQFADHPSLDNCREGFLQGLAQGGYVEGENLTIDYQCAQSEMANTSTIAQGFVARKVDLICAIATPSALAAAQAAQQENIPVVFNAVSEPVEAGLIQSFEEPGENITGVSDKLPIDKLLQLIRDLLPDADTIGIIYTTSEANSISHLEQIEALAPSYGFTIDAVGITASNEIASACDALISRGVDCHQNFTDNTVVAALPLLLSKFDEAGIPVFGSEEEQVYNGCLASEGIDYVALGVRCGLQAAAILDGTPAGEIPAEVVIETTPTINEDVMARYGITLPDSVSERAVLVKTRS